MWLKGEWISVGLHHPHPHLDGYVLNILSNGEPSWVKAETIRTYQGRIKKRERERTSQSHNWWVLLNEYASFSRAPQINE